MIFLSVLHDVSFDNSCCYTDSSVPVMLWASMTPVSGTTHPPRPSSAVEESDGASCDVLNPADMFP